MADNVVDFEHAPTIEKLIQSFGLAECKRLGFVMDEDGVLRLTTSGYGYLLFVEARDVKTVQEAFAAGYMVAKEHG